MNSYQECQELKNIKYKTMLQNNKNKLLITSLTNDLSNINILLDNECLNNKKENWNKLDKSIKMNKIIKYIDCLSIDYKLTPNEKNILKEYLSIQLDRKKLLKNKEVIYSKEKGIINNIPSLVFNNTTRKFSLKKNSQHISSSKSLGPTKKKKSRSNKIINE
jgi:hypothetical protein